MHWLFFVPLNFYIKKYGQQDLHSQSDE